MVVSLYICDIPDKIGKNILEDLFHDLEGYKEMRIKATKDRRIIAFADFNSEEDAKIALNTFQGFKFSEEDRGLTIKFADNTKMAKDSFGSNYSKKDKEEKFLRKKRKYSTDKYEKERDKDRDRDRDREKERSSRNRYRSYSPRRSSSNNSQNRNSPKDNINEFKSNMGIILLLNKII